MTYGSHDLHRILDLVGGKQGNRAIGVFACYLDDSYDRDSSIITLAGHFANLNDWKTFEDLVRPSTKPVKLFLRTKTPGRSPLTAFSLGGCTPNEGTEQFEKISYFTKICKKMFHK